MVINTISWCQLAFSRFPPEILTEYDVISEGFFIRENSFQLRIKRLGDFLVSIFLLFLTFPIIFFASILIKLEDNGPIFYSQIRTGKFGKRFRIWKLRTMRVNAEKDGIQWSKRNDYRITNIGRFLRASRIDELPQLVSVLIGDMSLIGPRPERPEIDSNLKEIIPYYDLRYLVKPGLSGWAQVNYPYGSSIEDSEMKLTYDFFYIKNFSFWLDLLIFFRTIRLVTRREGAISIN